MIWNHRELDEGDDHEKVFFISKIDYLKRYLGNVLVTLIIEYIFFHQAIKVFRSDIQRLWYPSSSSSSSLFPLPFPFPFPPLLCHLLCSVPQRTPASKHEFNPMTALYSQTHKKWRNGGGAWFHDLIGQLSLSSLDPFLPPAYWFEFPLLPGCPAKTSSLHFLLAGYFIQFPCQSNPPESLS